MLTKRKTIQPTNTPSDHWVITTDVVINGRHVRPGTQLSITGRPGRWTFIRHVVNGEHEWIDVRADEKRGKGWHAARTSQVRRVHRKDKGLTRTGAA